MRSHGITRDHKTNRAILGTVFFFRVSLGWDSIFTALHGIFRAGFGAHGTPPERIHYVRDFTGYFAQDAVST